MQVDGESWKGEDLIRNVPTGRKTKEGFRGHSLRGRVKRPNFCASDDCSTIIKDHHKFCRWCLNEMHRRSK